MLMPASSEFITLCRSQIAILTQGLGASFGVVYLTEELTDAINAKLIPIAAYPDAADWNASDVLSLSMSWKKPAQRLLASDASAGQELTLPALPASKRYGDASPSETVLLPEQQIVLPLVHEDMMMGLLVTARSDRAWSDREQAQIERIATTLSLACVLDQRAQWIDHDLHQQRLLRAQQHDIFDDLLHQFRNPLTAVRTFGKLLLKRLLPGEANRDVAEGIVRESDRLQDLLKQFDTAIDLGEADLLPVLTADESSAHTQPYLSQAWSSPSGAAQPPKSTPLLPSTRFLTGTSLELEPHPVLEVLEPLLNSAQAIAQDRQLDLQIHIPADLPLIKADLRALREVLNNLIDNALKYTPAGGAVYIWSSQNRSLEHDTMQGIAIADTGPGIPVEDLNHLFERHYRGVQAATEIPGSGLGLAIARELVRQMQGEIEVFSPVKNSPAANPFEAELSSHNSPGTVFIVWLPLA